MDIVAESLSANLLRARNVTVRGQDVFEWFQSKLSAVVSAAVSFAGVFDELSAAPKRNGVIAIVGSKDYVYSDPPGEWKEFGDEGQIGALTQAVQALFDELSCYAKKSEVSSVSAVSQLSNDVGYISAEADPVFRSLSSSFLTAHQSLSGYYERSETSSASQLEAALSGKAAAASTLSGYGIADARIDGGRITLGSASLDTSSFLTAETEPAFGALSSSFLTAHQSLSGCQPVGDYATRTELPRAVSELSNDAGYALSADVVVALSALRREFLNAVSGVVSAVYSYDEDEIYGG